MGYFDPMILSWLERYKGAMTDEDLRRVDEAPMRLNSAGFDPFGFHPQSIREILPLVTYLYRNYFRVEVQGRENIPDGRVLLVSNHGGQVPLDGMLIGAAMLLEGKTPRFTRAMIERWVPGLPFVNSIFNRMGQIIGDPRNCKQLLEQDNCVLVFPEGVKGSGKTISERYQIKRFGTGFLRLALETKSPIVPVSVIGCEEAYPSVINLKPLAKLLNAPYFPLTVTFPLLGPLGLLPLPTKVTIRFGKPLTFSETSADAPESEVRELVEVVRTSIRDELRRGLLQRKDRLFTGSAKDPGAE
jgi:1-acyl-sn-glycerol-3-phosphate acyltransferase